MADAALGLALVASRGRVHKPLRATSLGTASVVLPCYRYGHYLRAAVEAAFDQPGLDVEVVIVDDCSPDDSGAVAEELAAADSRIKVLRHRDNRGHIATYNDGLAMAEGDFVALVSADDLLTPGSLSRAAALMTEHPSVGFVYGRARHFSGEPPRPELGVSHWITWTGDRWLRARFRGGNNVIASPEVVMRGSVLRRIGGYRPDLPHSGDLEMWMRAATVADVGYIVGPDQALYRQHESNMHNATFRVGQLDTAAVDLQHRWAAFRTVLREPAAPLRDAAALEKIARRTLVAEALDGAASVRSRGGPDDVVEQFVALAREIRSAPVAAPRGARIPQRARNRVRSNLRWWRLNRVGT